MEYAFNSVPAGTYNVVITGNYHRGCGRFISSFYIGTKKQTNILVKEYATEVVKIKYPDDCKYRRFLENKICPK